MVRVELVQNPEDYIEEVIKRVRKEYLIKTYKVEGWNNATEFLEKMAARTGKLLKKGEPDISQVAKMVLNDWQRGKLPFYVAPEGFEVPLTKQQESTENKEVDTKQINDEKEDQKSEDSNPLESKDDTECNQQALTINKLLIAQDFAKIRVGLQFDNVDDVKPLDDIVIPEELQGIDEQNDENKTENDNAENIESINKENELNDDSDSDISNFYSDTENVCSDVEDHLTNDVETIKELKRKRLEASSGTFTVEEMLPTGKKHKANVSLKNLKAKMTAKQRRALDRAQKRTKTGSNFYEVSNVKNKNRNKKRVVEKK